MPHLFMELSCAVAQHSCCENIDMSVTLALHCTCVGWDEGRVDAYTNKERAEGRAGQKLHVLDRSGRSQVISNSHLTQHMH